MDNIENQSEQIEQEDEKISARDISKKTLNRKIWTQKEDKLLEKAINELGTNWKEVAKYLYNRNPSQCAQRWKRIKPISLRSRHSWSAEEDKQLLDLVKVHKRNWGMIASVMHWRTGKQIRERFINKLNPEIRTEPWTKEEDLTVMEAYKKFGSRWTEISKFLKGRPENMIKNRFYSFIRKEYMNIQNPYYVIPNSQEQKTEDDLDLQKQINQDNEENNKLQENIIDKQQKDVKVSKKSKLKKMKKLKIKKIAKPKQQQVEDKQLIKQKQQIQQKENKKEVLDGIPDTHSSDELQVKEEDEEEYPQIVNWLNLSQNLQFNNFNQGLQNSSQILDPFKSVYNSQALQSPPQMPQQQQQSYLAAFYAKYCENIANLIRSQSVSQSQFIKENAPVISHVSSQETQQSQLHQLSLSSFSFLPSLPCLIRPESFPHSMNNSQI